MGDSSGTTSYTETVPKRDTDSGTHPPAGPGLSSPFPPHQSHFAPSSSTTEDQERCRKRPPLGGARQPTDIDRSLARSLVWPPPRRLHLLWRDSVLPRSRPEVARAHNRTGNSPVGSPTPPHPTREHGERGPGWTFGATKTKVRPRPQAARKTGESIARSLTENKDR